MLVRQNFKFEMAVCVWGGGGGEVVGGGYASILMTGGYK